MSQDPWTTPVIVASTLAAGTGVCLALWQTDAVSRRVLAPLALHRKRSLEYQYRWRQAVERLSLFWRYSQQGGYNKYDADHELLVTEFVSTTEQINDLVDKILNGEKTGLKTAHIGPDLRQNDAKETYLWLVHADSTCGDSSTYLIYQVPLLRFGLALADALDRKISATTFCFLHDNSAGRADEMLQGLVRACKLDVLYIATPVWMAGLAQLVEQRTIAKNKMESLLLALCRLEVVLRTVAVGSAKPPAACLVCVPSALIPTLLPMLQRVFPDDRHVFGYTSAHATVQRALLQRNHFRKSHVPQNVADCLTLCAPVTYTTPLTNQLTKSSSLMKSAYLAANAQVPIDHADALQCWMASIDTMFALKDELNVAKSNDSAFVPYVWQLELLLQDGPLAPGADRYWSLRSLLQYVTGSRSRGLPAETIDAATSWLRVYSGNAGENVTRSLSFAGRRAIGSVVFTHKLILIPQKTLQDTVLPREHWTLLQASRGGCACCAPEEELSDDEPGASWAAPGAFANTNADGAPRTGVTERSSNSSSTQSAKSRAFVDGSVGFAFDPNQFSA